MNVLMLIEQFGGHDNGNRFSHDFRCCVTVNLLRARVPTQNNSLKSLGHDCIVRLFDDGGLPRLDFLRGFLSSNVLYHGNYQRRGATVQQRKTQASPEQRAVGPRIPLLQLRLIDRAGAQLLKESPILFSIFGRGEVNAVFVSHLLLAEAKHRTESRIYKQWLTLQGFDRDSDWTRIENIPKDLRIKLRGGCRALDHNGRYIALFHCDRKVPRHNEE